MPKVGKLFLAGLLAPGLRQFMWNHGCPKCGVDEDARRRRWEGTRTIETPSWLWPFGGIVLAQTCPTYEELKPFPYLVCEDDCDSAGRYGVRVTVMCHSAYGEGWIPVEMFEQDRYVDMKEICVQAIPV